MSTIDPYKIPAFQRKAKMASKKTGTRGAVNNYQKLLKKEESLIDPKPSVALRNNRVSFSPPVVKANSKSSSAVNFRKMKLVGKATHYFKKIDVAVVELSVSIRVGDSLVFQSNEGLFEQRLESMQIDRKEVRIARAGQSIGTKVKAAPLIGGMIYKVIHEE